MWTIGHDSLIQFLQDVNQDTTILPRSERTTYMRLMLVNQRISSSNMLTAYTVTICFKYLERKETQTVKKRTNEQFKILNIESFLWTVGL